MRKRIPGDSDLFDTITYKLDTLHRTISLLREHSYITRTGLSMSEGRCLATIGSIGVVNLRDLAQRANLHPGQASRTVQALVQRGLATKKASPTDAREVQLTLTKDGIKVWQLVTETIDLHNAEFFASLTDKERLEFSRMLSKLIADTKD